MPCRRVKGITPFELQGAARQSPRNEKGQAAVGEEEEAAWTQEREARHAIQAVVVERGSELVTSAAGLLFA